MTSINLKINSKDLDSFLDMLNKFDVKDLEVSREGDSEDEAFSVRESHAAYIKGEKTFSLEDADRIVDDVIKSYES